MEQEQQSGEIVEIPDFAVSFAARVPWRPVRSLAARLDGRDPCEPTDPRCEHQRALFGQDEPVADPHWYAIRSWPSVGARDYWQFTRIVSALGYRARYVRPYDPRPLLGRYLEFGEFVYWCVPPNQVCRTRIEWHQHEPCPGPGEIVAPAPADARGSG